MLKKKRQDNILKETELTSADKVIRKICYSSSIIKLRSKTRVYNSQKIEQISLNQLKQRLMDSNKNLVQHFLPGLNEIVRYVLM